MFYRSRVDIEDNRFVLAGVNEGKCVVIGQRERLTARWTHKVLVFFLPKWFSHHSIINITDYIVLTRSDHRTTHV